MFPDHWEKTFPLSHQNLDWYSREHRLSWERSRCSSFKHDAHDLTSITMNNTGPLKKFTKNTADKNRWWSSVSLRNSGIWLNIKTVINCTYMHALKWTHKSKETLTGCHHSVVIKLAKGNSESILGNWNDTVQCRNV